MKITGKSENGSSNPPNLACDFARRVIFAKRRA
jgi:hypothetical protein